MSDALTNSEIEDVLTSVRRLVAEDVRRSAAGNGAEARAVGNEAGRPGGRLILTQAQRIDADNADAPQAAVPPASPAPAAAPAPVPELTQAPQMQPVQPVQPQQIQTPRIPSPPQSHQAQSSLTPPPDFRRLEATIAELEAAVSASGSVFEPDGSEAAPASNVTALYAKPSFLHAAPTEKVSPRPSAPDKPAAPAAQAEPADAGTDALSGDGFDEGFDDDGLFETIIDEATLRILVAQIVREELQGQLGERVTLQVRKLVRSEIAKALDSRDLI